MNRVWFLLVLVALLLMCKQSESRAKVIYVDATELQQAVDTAPPHSILMADRNLSVEISKTILIDRPLTLIGLNARLKPGLGGTSILEIVAEDVHIRDFNLEGNGDSVTQAERAPLIVVRRSRFVIENGETNNSAKDGVMITPDPEFGDIEHGVVRNLTGHDTIRDIVSIGGAGDRSLFVRHLVVENIRAYNSRLRGPVEVSDGSEHITVRDVYAESCLYGVDVQDHGREGMINRHIVIEGVQVRNCKMAIRTANNDFGHDGLTIRNVTIIDWQENESPPIDVKNTKNLVIDNVQIQGAVKGPAIRIRNCDNLTIRNVTVADSGTEPGGKDCAVQVEDSDRALIDNVVIVGERQPEIGVFYRVRADERFGGLRIHNVMAENVLGTGIVVENLSQSGSLDSYLITGNMATVEVKLTGRKGLVEGNLE